jgi:hypothetical protein
MPPRSVLPGTLTRPRRFSTKTPPHFNPGVTWVYLDRIDTAGSLQSDTAVRSRPAASRIGSPIT